MSYLYRPPVLPPSGSGKIGVSEASAYQSVRVQPEISINPISASYLRNVNSGEPESVKLQRAEAETLDFLTRTGFFDASYDEARVIQALRGLGISVYDEANHPWAKQVFQKHGAAAMAFMPTSIAYQDGQLEVLNTAMGYPEAFVRVREDEDRLGRPFILMGRYNAFRHDKAHKPERLKMLLAHEIFHLFQFKNGLSFSEPDRVTNVTASGITAQYLQRLHAKWYTPTAIAVVLIDPLKSFAWKCVHLLNRDQREPNTVGVGIRTQARRELEAYRFIGRHGRQMGLSLFYNWNLKYSTVTAYKRLINMSYKYGPVVNVIPPADPNQLPNITFWTGAQWKAD